MWYDSYILTFLPQLIRNLSSLLNMASTQIKEGQFQSSLDQSNKNELLASESAATQSFLKIVNEVIRGNTSMNPMSEKTALKFLISRKFDIQRAVQLYQMHEVTRLREDLVNIDPNDPDLKSELASGKFTIYKHRDANESAIAVFTAKLHSPEKSISSKSQSSKKDIHRCTLQGIVFQLDCALEDITTQRKGIVFVYNMSHSDYSNFDYDLCQKILNLLKGAYPAKLKKVLIVSPPLWFRAPFLLLRLIVREKLRDRVSLLNISQLSDHIPINALSPELGGTYHHDHEAWLNQCHNLYKTRLNDLCDLASAENLAKSFNTKPNNYLKRSSNEIYDVVEEPNLSSDFKNFKRGSDRGRSPIYNYDDSGIPLNQFVELMKKKGKKGLGEEYELILENERFGTFFVSSSSTNMRKNRYINIKCYDHTRVVLEPHDLNQKVSSDDPMDYINASYVDGYRQPKAYISTQGPTSGTINDFWRMIWQTGCRVIVMVTLDIENGMIKCDIYWPDSDSQEINAGIYKIEYLQTELSPDLKTTRLRLTNTQSEVSREIWHLQFLSWPDFGTPQTASALLKFRDSVLKKQLDAIELSGSGTYPPIVVHCSAGVGRSGTFITIDICIQKLETTGLIDVKGVVEKLREQRYSSIQTKDQYIFCYMSVLEYAVKCGLFAGEDLNALLAFD